RGRASAPISTGSEHGLSHFQGMGIMSVSAGTQAGRPGAAVLIGALGVVYGDIGTSPLYTIRAALSGLPDAHHEHILGVLSLLFWMLMFVVSLKYVTMILRADNRGEGGTLALMELAVRGLEGRRRWVMVILGLI